MGTSLESVKNVSLSGAMVLLLTEIKTVTGHIRLVKLDLFCCCCCWPHCMAFEVLVHWLNWTQALAGKALIPNHWTTREFPVRLVVDIAFTANQGSSMWKCQEGLGRYIVLGCRREYWVRNSDLVIISALMVIHVMDVRGVDRRVSEWNHHHLRSRWKNHPAKNPEENHKNPKALKTKLALFYNVA